jgi:hypothetical protein
MYCCASVGTLRSKRPPDGNDSRIPYSCVVRVLAHCVNKSPPDGNNSRTPYSEGSLPPKHFILKFKHENVNKMKNKPEP